MFGYEDENDRWHPLQLFFEKPEKNYPYTVPEWFASIRRAARNHWKKAGGVNKAWSGMRWIQYFSLAWLPDMIAAAGIAWMLAPYSIRLLDWGGQQASSAWARARQKKGIGTGKQEKTKS